MLHIMVEPPQNAGYMWAGYIVGLGILLGYTAWLLLRVKQAVDGKREEGRGERGEGRGKK